jgi:acetolactate synthase I/III small subunit
MSKSAYSGDISDEKLERVIIVAWVDNEAGVLARVSGLFSGRGYNIESLAVAKVDEERNISRITISTNGTKSVIEQIKAQLLKLVPVHNVADFKIDENSIFKELALIKFVTDSEKLKQAEKICIDFKVEFLDKTSQSFIAQIVNTRREIDDFIKKAKPFGLVSITRTGPLAMSKGSETTRDNKGKVL